MICSDTVAHLIFRAGGRKQWESPLVQLMDWPFLFGPEQLYIRNYYFEGYSVRLVHAVGGQRGWLNVL